VLWALFWRLAVLGGESWLIFTRFIGFLILGLVRSLIRPKANQRVDSTRGNTLDYRTSQSKPN